MSGVSVDKDEDTFAKKPVSVLLLVVVARLATHLPPCCWPSTCQGGCVIIA